MPLSPPAPRKLKHTRKIECQGFHREDGLWDVEAHLVDTKPFDVPNMDRPGGVLNAGEPMHEMWIRFTVDLDFEIKEVEVVTDWGPYSGCSAITPNFQALKGLRIVPGFTLRSRDLLGGVKGCTHLVELLGPLATTVYQTLYGARERAKPAGSDGKRPPLINTCHMYAADGDLVRKRWPEWAEPAVERTGKAD